MSAKTLHEAASSGDVARVKELLPTSKVNGTVSRSGTSYTPLHLAAAKGHTEVVKLLLETGAQPDKLVEKKGKKKTTAIHLALKKGHVEVVRLLVEASANVNIEDSKGNMPLDFALSESKQNFLDCVELLLTHGVDLQADSARYLRKAVYYGNMAGFKLLLAHGAEFKSIDEVSMWQLVIKKGHLDLLKLLVDNGLKIKKKKKKTNTTALHFASKKGTKEIVAYLLDNCGFDKYINNETTSRNLTPLHYAAERGKADIAELLISHGAKINQVAIKNDKTTPLHLSSERDHVEVVQQLLKGGADVNAVNGKFFTPLHLASKAGHSDIVRVLLEYEADVSIKSGCTAKDMAITEEVVELINEAETKSQGNPGSRRDLEISQLKAKVARLEEELSKLKKEKESAATK